MSIADIGGAIGDFLTPSEDTCGVCLAQAYLNSMFNLSSGKCFPEKLIVIRG